ncbi:hypothetical protein, partial [uncultured Victivallis sp.]|uniref:hypothetical protein n=1 Tax=uncultured Victivallis sp. TaxID=354118 RepID=UPI002588CBB7
MIEGWKDPDFDQSPGFADRREECEGTIRRHRAGQQKLRVYGIADDNHVFAGKFAFKRGDALERRQFARNGHVVDGGVE